MGLILDLFWYFHSCFNWLLIVTEKKILTRTSLQVVTVVCLLIRNEFYILIVLTQGISYLKIPKKTTASNPLTCKLVFLIEHWSFSPSSCASSCCSMAEDSLSCIVSLEFWAVSSAMRLVFSSSRWRQKLNI